MTVTWNGIAIVCCLASAISCGRRTDRHLVETLFAGFAFAGSDETLADPASQLGQERALPTMIRAGHRYVFYLPLANGDAGSWTSIRDRLITAGAEILSGPKDARDLLNVTVGGPVFEFRFRYDSRTGTVGNQLEPRVRRDDSLARVWKPESYFLQMDDAAK